MEEGGEEKERKKTPKERDVARKRKRSYIA
jgi:hypothetical protein